MQWHMDLVEANVKRILNVLDAIEFAAGSWNIVGRLIIRNCWIKSDIIEAPQIANKRSQMIIESSASPSKKTAASWMI